VAKLKAALKAHVAARADPTAPVTAEDVALVMRGLAGAA